MRLEIRECNFQDIENDWRIFEKEGCVKFPYLTYDWMNIWWKHYRHRARRLILLAVYDQGDIIAIAPFWLRSVRLKKIIPLYDIISFIGAREIDYGDIISKDNNSEILKAIILYLQKTYPSAIKYFCDIRPERIEDYNKATASLRHKAIESGSVYPYISLPDNIEDYWSNLGISTRKGLKLKLNRVKKLPGFRVQKNSDVNMADYLFKLHYQRWGMDPEKEPIKILEHYERELINVFCPRDIIKFITVYSEDKCLGTIMVYDYQGTRYYHKMGYDVNYKKYSLGYILLYLAIEDAIKNKISEFDLLRGDEFYKSHFTDKRRTAYNITLSNNIFGLKLFRMLK